jgi:hypothetical protein
MVPLPRKIPETPVVNRSTIGVTTLKIRGFNRWISGCIDFSVFKKTSSLGISGVDPFHGKSQRPKKPSGGEDRFVWKIWVIFLKRLSLFLIALRYMWRRFLSEEESRSV